MTISLIPRVNDLGPAQVTVFQMNRQRYRLRWNLNIDPCYLTARNMRVLGELIAHLAGDKT